MIKPKKLQPGDKVATISLSWGGAGTFPHRYAAGKRQLQETFDLEVVETRHALHPADWLDRRPQARAADLMEAFTDSSIQGIISIIGGDDSIRLLPFLDLDVIRANPKVFLGFSDTTVTHLACFKAGLVSFYGPAILAGFAENGGLFPYMVDAVRRTLFSATPPGEIAPNTAGWTVERSDWGVPADQAHRRALQPTAGRRWLQGRCGGPAAGRLPGCFGVGARHVGLAQPCSVARGNPVHRNQRRRTLAPTGSAGAARLWEHGHPGALGGYYRRAAGRRNPGGPLCRLRCGDPACCSRRAGLD